ncbi:hypothetical protein M9H77_03670 [Catharanthus roseus]|uniref:Uncharacterized protein n=1 Tax=Catharanthus roseus TaxID=4058 RepID=A0ACC0CC32_CATRO|nr:hypothetical protein M9H77_03670 [Catharanthus roseus]
MNLLSRMHVALQLFSFLRMLGLKRSSYSRLFWGLVKGSRSKYENIRHFRLVTRKMGYLFLEKFKHKSLSNLVVLFFKGFSRLFVPNLRILTCNSLLNVLRCVSWYQSQVPFVLTMSGGNGNIQNVVQDIEALQDRMEA